VLLLLMITMLVLLQQQLSNMVGCFSVSLTCVPTAVLGLLGWGFLHQPLWGWQGGTGAAATPHLKPFDTLAVVEA
jgi:hypothetical protein